MHNTSSINIILADCARKRRINGLPNKKCKETIFTTNFTLCELRYGCVHCAIQYITLPYWFRAIPFEIQRGWMGMEFLFLLTPIAAKNMTLC